MNTALTVPWYGRGAPLAAMCCTSTPMKAAFVITKITNINS
eukprot:CAMPEP_0115602840 /NCGR_PEP_ID=MMETSP0272-20121206/16117_1 /TAXON_ID=71861 /ORGANISM="Scrippsiella trochoidea, Strain CCMP3099" /LENGTH=40 /DNA_ID= /DNA_START= /DNA_END= /DNA_ORIENTATION=